MGEKKGRKGGDFFFAFKLDNSCGSLKWAMLQRRIRDACCRTQSDPEIWESSSCFGSVDRQLCFASYMLCLREYSMILLHPAYV